MLRRRLNEEEELDLEQPSAEDTTSAVQTDDTSSISTSSIQSIVQSEVNRQLADYRGKQGEMASSKEPEEVKKDNHSQEINNKEKKQSLQTFPKKSFPTIKNSKKSKSASKHSRPHQVQLQPINISPQSNLVPFESRQVADLLGDTFEGLCIISACNSTATAQQNMKSSLLLQLDLLKQDYLYIPIYTVDRNTIVDLLFIVFNLGLNPKTSRSFPSFISSLQAKFNISCYVSLIKGRFYLVSDTKQVLNSLLYSRVIYYYSSLRRIQVSNQRRLFVNPAPTSQAELDYRSQRREICIEPIKKQLSVY